MRTKIGNGHGQGLNLEQFLEDIKVVVKDGEELLKAGVSTVRERAIKGAQSTDRTVRQYPYHTMGAVFGAGLLVGLLAAGWFGGGSEYEQE